MVMQTHTVRTLMAMQTQSIPIVIYPHKVHLCLNTQLSRLTIVNLEDQQILV